MSAMQSGGVAAILAMVLALPGCRREERRFQEVPAAAQPTNAVVMGDLRAGNTPPEPSAAPQYVENAFEVTEGKRLFEWFNCVGCHAHGGGAIGPPLMDHRWIYGSDPANIYSTIVEGRPNGMPSFRKQLRPQQVWQLVAYVRSMSGLARKDATGGRSDSLSVKPQEQSMPEVSPINAGSPP
jgi:cytochrome c oxidase cbb3-type subunit III